MKVFEVVDSVSYVRGEGVKGVEISLLPASVSMSLSRLEYCKLAERLIDVYESMETKKRLIKRPASFYLSECVLLLFVFTVPYSILWSVTFVTIQLDYEALRWEVWCNVNVQKNAIFLVWILLNFHHFKLLNQA